MRAKKNVQFMRLYRVLGLRAAPAARTLPNICLAAAAAALGPSTVRPEVSMRWMTRWSSTIFCLARSRMSSSTVLDVRKR